jgi:K+ transporter
MPRDNRGEGGTFALLALLRPERAPRLPGQVLILVGLLGASMLVFLLRYPSGETR